MLLPDISRKFISSYLVVLIAYCTRVQQNLSQAVAVQGSAPASVLIDGVSPSDSAMSTLRCRGLRETI